MAMYEGKVDPIEAARRIYAAKYPTALIDYRIYDPSGDGKTKLDHVREMLEHAVSHKRLPFQAVLMDTWYATKDLMLYINGSDRIKRLSLHNS